ncbi:MAG: hypothetical protein QM639_09600 [Rhodocyclaceae bacterium]
MLGALFAATGAYAAPPPANTLIGNQASASYTDPNGLGQVATSNQVQTSVRQVGAFNLDGQTAVTTLVINNKVGAAGATVYAPHVLTNTGNGAGAFDIVVTPPTAAAPNSFADVKVYADSNFDGLPDSTAALCTSTPATAPCTLPAQTVAGNNGQYGFVVAYSIPSTAVAAWPTQVAQVNAKPVMAEQALYASANQAAEVLDNVKITTAAAFNLSKSLAQPAAGVTAAGSGAWPAATATGKRSSSSTCPTTWAATMATSPAAGCQYTVYTLTYSNTGGASGKFNLTDVIGTGDTAGFTYVAGSAVWSNAPGTALADGGTGNPTGIDFKFDTASKTLTFIDNTLPVNVTRSVSFVVLVNDTALVGTASTTNQAKFSTEDVPLATLAVPAGLTGSSSKVPFTVLGSYGVVIGSATAMASTTGAVAGAKDTTAGTPNAGAFDTNTVASVAAGDTAVFDQWVHNTGNAVDAINITDVSPGTGGGTAFPAGTVFRLYKADGSTPLSDTNGDGIFDTGPIQAGQNVKIVVKAQLPPTTPVAAAQTWTVTVTATSVGDGTQKDATRNILQAVTGSLVDLTNSATGLGTGAANDDVGIGPSAAPTSVLQAKPGDTVAFPLFVKNSDTAAVTYNLAASSTASFPGTLPAGWTVKFIATAGTCAPTDPAITTLAVAANAQGDFKACVTAPATAPAGIQQAIFFQVRGTTIGGKLAVDTKYDAVTILAASATASITLTPDNNGQVAPGGSVAYAHTLNNTGTAVCTGTYTLTTAFVNPADAAAGWTTSVYLDVNGDGLLDGGDTLVTGAITPAGGYGPGSVQKLLVKVFAPGGALAGATSAVNVTVTFTPALPGDPVCGPATAKDTSTVITGQIRLTKTQAHHIGCTGPLPTTFSAQGITGAKPGDCIVYEVVATNQGAANVTNLMIHDSVPAFTSLNGAVQPAAGTQCTSSGVTPALAATDYTQAATSVSCGSASNTVQPGGSATLRFSVKIDM